MAVRDALNDNAYEMLRMDNVRDTVDLTISGWNRTTIADGQWLQDHAIGPLSARDVYLADQIDETNSAVDLLRSVLDDAGIGTLTGDVGFGYSLKPLNNHLNPYAQYLPATMSFGTYPISLVSRGVGDSVVPPYAVTYTTFGPAVSELGGIDGVSDNSLGGVLTLHNGNAQAFQLAFTDAGMWYRKLAGVSGEAHFDNADAAYITTAADFKKVPTDAISESDLNSKLDDYYKKTETSSSDAITTALDTKLDKTTFASYTADMPTKDYVNDASAHACTAAVDEITAKNYATKDELTGYIPTATENLPNSAVMNVKLTTMLDGATTTATKSVSAWLQEIVNTINELSTTTTV